MKTGDKVYFVEPRFDNDDLPYNLELTISGANQHYNGPGRGTSTQIQIQGTSGTYYDYQFIKSDNHRKIKLLKLKKRINEIR